MHYAIEGLDHGIFTDEREAAIADYVKTELISQGALFSDENFKALILSEYLLCILANDEQPIRIFWPAADSLRDLGSVSGFDPGAHTVSAVRPRIPLLLMDAPEKWQSYSIQFPWITYWIQTRRACGSTLAESWHRCRLGRMRSRLKSLVRETNASQLSQLFRPPDKKSSL
jgi:hypothetical protein